MCFDCQLTISPCPTEELFEKNKAKKEKRNGTIEKNVYISEILILNSQWINKAGDTILTPIATVYFINKNMLQPIGHKAYIRKVGQILIGLNGTPDLWHSTLPVRLDRYWTNMDIFFPLVSPIKYCSLRCLDIKRDIEIMIFFLSPSIPKWKSSVSSLICFYIILVYCLRFDGKIICETSNETLMGWRNIVNILFSLN